MGRMSKGSNRGESFCSRAVIAKVVPTSNPTSSLAQHLTIAAYNFQDGRGVVPHTKSYHANLIFWIVMGCGIARFVRKGLKTTAT